MRIKIALSVATIIAMGNFLSANETTVLEEISVSETSTNLPSYTVKETSSATKLDLSLKETPQSITVITQKQIEDQNLTDVGDILLQSPGVSVRQQGAKNGGSLSYFARGFEIKNYQRDGIPVSRYSFGGNNYFAGLENSAIYEQVEIIRGSTGLTNGSGNPSASINFVRKKPTKDFQGDAKVSYGSWDTYKGQIDLSGALNEAKTIKGRFIALYGDGESQQDRYTRDDSLIYSALDFDLSDNTLLTTALNYQKINSDNITTHGFVRATADGKKQTTFGKHDNPAANWTYSDLEKLNLLVGLEHYFNNDWKTVANYSYTKVKQDRVHGFMGAQLNYTTGMMSASAMKIEATPDVHALDLYTTGNFKAFGQEHELSFGANGYSVKSDDPSYSTVTINTPYNGWNGSSVSKPNFVQNGKTKVDEQEVGAFIALNLQLSDPLKLIIGSRITNWERVNNKGKLKEREQKEDNVVIPYLGLVYDINENFSTYASYTSIFNPITSQDKDGNYLDPEKGNSVEFGLKSEFYDGLLNTSIAYFITKQDNKAVTDPDYIGQVNSDGNSISKSIDGAEIKGWDLTIGGEILPNWNMQGGYTYTDAKDQNKDRLGSDVTPKHTFKLFTTYKHNKLTLGGGVNYQSEIYNTGNNREINTQKAYSIVNVMAKYDVNKDFDVILNVNNLFDKEYILYPNQESWGAERNYTLSLNYKF